MKLYIKYMVSLRCRMQVRSELNRLGYPLVVFDLGLAEIPKDMLPDQRELFGKKLKRAGMLLLDNDRSVLMDEAKKIIAEELAKAKPHVPFDIHDVLTSRLKIPSKEISDLFSEVKGISLTQYLTTSKIEIVKELLLYEDLTLDEIALRLHFTNRVNLSYQFKKITGLSPSYYRLIKEKRRNNQQMRESAAFKTGQHT